jgi:hypothetical protein
MKRFSAHQQGADGELERIRLRAPSRVANAARNAQAGFERRRRWAPARDALWDFVGPHLEDGARVAVVGAGNGDDLPLRRIAQHADAVTLIDIDPGAARGARRRLGRAERRKVEVIGHDVTAGAADAIVLAALGGAPGGGSTQEGDATAREPAAASMAESISPARPPAAGDPLPGAPYDLVVGDLLYSQLLYPALVDLGVDAVGRDAVLARHGPSMTAAVVSRLHASAPLVVHVHDPLAWWDGHEQPVALAEILDRAEREGPDAALDLAAQGDGPDESDPRAAFPRLGLAVAATALWRWPFAPGVDYLACATLATVPDSGSPDGSNL